MWRLGKQAFVGSGRLTGNMNQIISNLIRKGADSLLSNHFCDRNS